MKKRLLAIVMAAALFSCSNKEKAVEAGQPGSETTNENGESMNSIDFAKKMQSDNFFKSEVKDKTIKLNNLLVLNYSFNKEKGEAKVNCLAFDPSQNLINDECNMIMGELGAYRKVYYMYNGVKLNILESNSEYTPDEYCCTFEIRLSNAKDIQALSLYDNSESSKDVTIQNEDPSKYDGNIYRQEFKDLINITGTYTKQNRGKTYVFEDCTFEKSTTTISSKMNSQKEQEISKTTTDAASNYYKVNDPDGYSNLRKSPKGEVIKKVYDTEVFEVIATENDFKKVKLSDGTIGYIHSSRCVKVD